MNHWWVVPAAGTGRRFGTDLAKQYQLLAGKPVIVHTLERLLAVDPVGIVLVLHSEDRHWSQLALARNPRIHVVAGGAERTDSVRAGLHFLEPRVEADDWVLVHDVARPCVAAGDIRSLMNSLGDDPVGGILAAPVSDTIKRVVNHRQIQGTEERSHLWAAMTPQMFRYGLLCRALDESQAAGLVATDESAAVESCGLAPRVVMGRRDNIKITRPEDIAIAGAILSYQLGETP
ncbi:MAG: hypothetical protein VR73_06745 [Gammaproteobacteria bacterium BRH_c0]|nr:MAG: hypothetical protein VR73_06745 [Gammaproteobacteria bacterium BRH_c0]